MPPLTHRLANGGVLRVWRGMLTAQGQFEGTQEFLTLDGVADLKYAIVDYRGVTSHDVRPTDARRVAEVMRQLGPIRIVAIAPQDVIFGFGRMVELTRADDAEWRLYVTRTVDEALAWLERELPELDFTEAREMLDAER